MTGAAARASVNINPALIIFFVKTYKVGFGDTWIQGIGWVARILTQGPTSVGQYWLMTEVEPKIWNEVLRECKYKAQQSALTWGKLVERSSSL